ncbi:Uncharacterized membrane protein YeiH [Sporobacter termitidis DSM 10068]|uniref:Uncharacterized membrane protein YeiH n=1 Tax=Sporobacter termitidis DSM 10068 TaxID=1123282 RepID=A0A1M5Y8C6_9FIRM|nr:trimeric intracellular cation channel family protein [Sporobacter termitidis]SHI07733.1 Uncharacterized membrane protein YeiH [Sporobacter termitidis DSM 10068]
MNVLILVLEIIGTVAFAASGAMTGLKKKMDIFGVVILGLTTAVGGGVLRDLILGITPPQTFQDPMYALIAIATAIILFLPPVHRWLTRNLPLYEKVLVVMDALGLGIFTVVGIRVAFHVSHSFSGFLLIFVGVVTGVGGGIIRDVLAGDTPYILVKHIYAVASIIGAVVCVVLWHITSSIYAILAGTIIIVVIRVLSAHFKWNLPRANFDDAESKAKAPAEK